MNVLHKKEGGEKHSLLWIYGNFLLLKEFLLGFCFDSCIHLSLAQIGANQKKWSRMIKDDPGVFELHCWQSCLALLAKLPYIGGKVALHCWQSCLALVAKLPYIGGKVALHWWQSCFTLVAKSPCIVGLIYLSLNNKSESKIQEIALDTGRICCELIRSDNCRTSQR